MRSRDIASLAYGTINTHRLRSLLTALGIIIGIASVVILTAIGEGIHHYVLNKFTQFGTNLIAISPGKKTTFGMSGATINTVRPLALADAVSLSKLENILDVVPLVQGNARVEAGNRQRRVSVFGVGAAVPTVWQIKVDIGRFLPAGELQNPRALAVLGSKLRDEIFPNTSPLGKILRIGKDRFRVIGVMTSKGQMLGLDMDDSVYIPAAKAMAMFDRQGLMEIDLLYNPNASVDQVSYSIKRHLLGRHGHEDFTITTQNQMLETLESVLNMLKLAVAALGGISLLVGSVGVLTIMMIAVSERIAEIGLLRAIGAERRTIFYMFLSEALLLSVVGGLAGVVLGVLIVQIIQLVVPGLPIQLAWAYIAAATGVAFMIGLFAGIAPAMRAARLSPQEALRAE